jgi:GH25 family lysozyme M1 (1,4-beta-N-acetylmuramidase)
VQILKTFGHAAAGTPVCLDLERRTWEAAPSAALDYAVAWCQAVRQAGLRPGVYSNPDPLKALHARAGGPDWVWIASWILEGPDSGLDPCRATGMPAAMWGSQGQRVWQYASCFVGV